MNPPSRLAALSYTAAPAAFLGGWLLMRPIGGDAVPGPWWTAAHAVWLLAFLMFGVLVVELWRRTGRGGKTGVAAGVAAGLALLSVAANLTQLGIDLVAGLTSADGQAMHALFDRVQGYPGVEVAAVGAQLFLPALLALAVIMAVRGRAAPLSAAVVGVGGVVLAVATLAVGRNSPLVAAGISLMWLGTLLLGRDDDRALSAAPSRP
ncbi:hypothetical protein [Nonomuraea sp. NPDC046570]|uniref:hypothetical protein n=1 Tax=Nonomuraea sp. NPDC046570 TaxID=3155255 RepID=UPI003411348D